MKCAILCGGMGARLGELGEYLPKPLMRIGDKAVLEHIMDHYAKHGITDFVLCLGHLGDKIVRYFSNKGTNYKIEFVDTGEKSTKIDRLLKVKEILGDTFLVSYGDDLCNINIQKLIKFHNKEGRMSTLTVVRLPSSYGVLTLHDFEPHLVSEFKEKPLIHEWINGGYFVFDKRIFDYIKEGEELEDHVLVRLAKEKQLAAFRHDGFWKSMNTLKDSVELNEMFDRGELKDLFGGVNGLAD
ncbi:NTP transferase domain-containing protein [Candidatus Pacearchaeota archaeon]|nr:NTP transferase domain-containing protein [Candidatus Pacearchaeota archaeon]